MGKLPNHRSLYLLRFHPYARVKPSARERAMAARYTSDPDGLFSDEQRIISSYQTMVADSNHSLIIARGLDNAVNVTHSVDTHLRNLSVSTLVAVSTPTFIVNCVGPSGLDVSNAVPHRSTVSTKN